MQAQPAVLLAAAAELERIAEELAAAEAIHGFLTHVAPSGAEEVSLLAAAHFNHGSVTHGTAASMAIAELRHAATILAAQAAGYVAQDTGLGGVIQSIKTAGGH